jgi:valyl-tRNA synthetase
MPEARSRELTPTYDPKPVEGRVYQRWLDARAFQAPSVTAGRNRFSIAMPPPNVTGRLHMGHAMDNTLQDVFVRWHRMLGDAVLWVPGTDHAGIATQAVVEKRLQAMGESRRALGREAFLQRVWAWKEEYETSIGDQLRRLGCSCDWSRQRFTLDAGLSHAVEEVFVRYHREGLLYRGSYIVNWCPACGTAISDLEVEHEPEPSTLFQVRYPLEGGGEVIIATVRPETMLGDTAIAVHPDDGRFAGLIGRTALLPLVGRRIPIVADRHVDPSFGTGALKVTPAHDAADAALAARHALPAISVIGTDGRLTAEAGPRFAGLGVAEARRAVVEALRTEGLLVDEQAYVAPVGRCSRCGGIVEPLVSRQWFVRMASLAGAAADAVRAGRVRFVPESPFLGEFLRWMESAHDWCISRQIWWGHRIPAYECERCGETVVAADAPVSCPRCGAPNPQRDPDVLDTWFSSALWPFSTLGWPEAAADYDAYYPTDLLVTGRDILFFWVARMVFSGIHFTGREPFRTVLLHGLVRDAQGRKMSKSLGNGIDPLEIIDRYGADALRLTLLVGVAPGSDMRFAPDRLEGSQRFCNKLWNVARFAIGAPERKGPSAAPALADRWILSRLSAAAERASAALRSFDAGEALAGLQAFVWDEFCDWYVEAVKRRVYGNADDGSAESARGTLLAVLAGVLRLLHPFMPFITEEIWSYLQHDDLLIRADWPSPGEWPADPEAEARFGLVKDVISAVRSLRAEMRVPPAAQVAVLLAGPAVEGVLAEERETIRSLARVETLDIRAARPGELGVSAVVGAGVEVQLLLRGLVDVRAEVARLGRELDSAARERARTAARLADEAFRSRAKPEVVARETERLAALDATVARLELRLGQLQAERKEIAP